MEEYKLVADILASVAALVAILSMLVSWYRAARRPLKIDRVVIQQKQNGSKYILVVKNIKDFPVEIKSTNCYRRKLFNIEKRPGQKPGYSELLNLADNIFIDKTIFTIAPRGHTNISIQGPCIEPGISKLLFSIQTSHGYHEIWCKNILVLQMESADVYELDYRKEFHSKYKALLFYIWETAKSWFIK